MKKSKILLLFVLLIFIMSSCMMGLKRDRYQDRGRSYDYGMGYGNYGYGDNRNNGYPGDYYNYDQYKRKGKHYKYRNDWDNRHVGKRNKHRKPVLIIEY